MSWVNILKKVGRESRILPLYTGLIDEIMLEAASPLTTRQVVDALHDKFQEIKHNRVYENARHKSRRTLSGRYFPDIRQVGKYLSKNYVRGDIARSPGARGKVITWGERK